MPRATVRCRYCQTPIRIPECRADRLERFIYDFLTSKKWLYYGKKKGCCVDCNLFTPLNEIGNCYLNL